MPPGNWFAGSLLVARKYPKSSKAHRVLAYASRKSSGAEALVNALKILGRKANVCRPDGTEEHA